MSSTSIATGEPAYADLPDHTRAQRWMLRGIDAYQRAFRGRPSPCRFFPSCSEYGAEAIHRHGARRGLWLTVRRLARCRPFGPSGFDPVPERSPVERSHADLAPVPRSPD